MKLRKMFVVLLSMITLLIFAIPAFADVIYEPGDSFYEGHKDDCENNGYRQYIANSENGYIYIMKDPETDISVGALSNGERFVIPYIYTAPNGEQWGIYGYKSGWVRMSDVTLVYDSVEFLKDHKDECKRFSSEDCKFDFEAEKPIVAWSYPEGEVHSWKIEHPEDIQNAFGWIYQAPDGVIWGHIGYYYGSRDFWICISDPYAEDLSSITPPALNGAPVESGDIPPYPGNNIKPSDPVLKAEPVSPEAIPNYKGNRDTLIIIGALIAAVVAVTLVVIRVVYVKNKAKG